MIIMNLNLRGVGGGPKLYAFRRLLALINPNLILLQETLCDELKARSFINSVLPSWHVCSVGATGRSGGLLSAWNPTLFLFNSFTLGGGILLLGRSRVFDGTLNVFNCYGPQGEKCAYWESLAQSGLFNLSNLILAGDLVLTLGSQDSWGIRAQTSHNTWFCNFFDSVALSDITPCPLAPTW